MKNSIYPSLYKIEVSSPLCTFTYYGETLNIKRRQSKHFRGLLSKRHHCILLRRVFNEMGMINTNFIEISTGVHLKDETNRFALELLLIQLDENSLNTKGNESIYATYLRLPKKNKYISVPLYLEYQTGVVKVRDKRYGDLIGIERVKGKIPTGYYETDNKCYLTKMKGIK